ncbi:hypothetical protein A2U01_0081825, partial [Trifolium medium]|nr:hypothetical protein [Trifolium medium]
PQRYLLPQKLQADVGSGHSNSGSFVKLSQVTDVFRGPLALGFVFFDCIGGRDAGSRVGMSAATGG